MLSAFTLIEYSAFAWFLYQSIDKKILKNVILVSSILFYAFTIILYIRQLGMEDKSFDSLAASVEAILIVAFCAFYLFDQMSKPQVIFIYQEPTFWFVVGFIIYFSGALLLFIQASNLEREIRDNYWSINYFLNITKNILFAVAFSTKKSRDINYNYQDPFDPDFLENPYKT